MVCRRLPLGNMNEHAQSKVLATRSSHLHVLRRKTEKLKMFNALTKSISSLLNVNLRSAAGCVYEQLRTRVSCSKSDGKEKTVLTAMHRYFRISKRIWIRSQPGYHHKLWAKPLEKRFLKQQAVLCGRRESWMAEKMAGPKYRAISVEKFVDPPFVYYHSYAKQLKPEKEKFHVFP